MTTDLEAWLIDRIKAAWACPVYDSAPLEQPQPPYAVLERLPDVVDEDSPATQVYEQWRYAIYGVFPLSDLVGVSVGEGKRDKYQRLRDELHDTKSFTWGGRTYLCWMRVVGYDPTVDVPAEHSNAFAIRVEVMINA